MYRAKPPLRRKWLNALSMAMVMLSCFVSIESAWAQNFAPSDYRILVAGDKYDGARQYAAAFKIRPPRRLRSRHLELAIGAISGNSSSHAFISFGPVWRFPLSGDNTFVDLGFSPTVLGGSVLSDRDLGGNFHFTTSVSIGATFGKRRTVALSLRAQHTSNGGLSNTNPGLDMIGLNVSLNFSNL